MATPNFDNGNADDTIANYDLPKPLNADPHMYGLLGVLSSESDRIDLDAEHLYDQRFIDSATGEELEKIGFEVGVRRRDGENDEKLRARIYGNYAAQSSNTTYETFANALLTILDASPSAIGSIVTPPQSGDKHVEVNVELSALEDSPLTEAEIVDLLEDTVSADASVAIFAEGTFGFEGDTDNEGFNVGTWSSTVE